MDDALTSEVVAALKVGLQEWQNFRLNARGELSLINQHFEDKDFRKYPFSQINFAGCEFEHVDFEGARFTSCTFSNCAISHSTFRNCTFIDCTFSDSSLRDNTVRDNVFRGCAFYVTDISFGIFDLCAFVDGDFRNFSFESASIGSIEFQNSRVHGFHLSKTETKVVSLTKSVVRDFSVRGCTVDQLGALRSSISDSVFMNSQFEVLELTDCSIVTLRGDDLSCNYVDLSKSHLVDTDLTGFPVERAVLNGTSVRNCDWPEQIGTSSFFGNFVRAPRLLAHPVNDISGLDPLFFRNVAQQQFIARIQDSAKGTFKGRTVFRLWGILSDYGRSLSRFAFWGLVLVVAMALLQVISCAGNDNAAHSFTWNVLWEAFQHKSLVFFGIQGVPAADSAFCSYAFDTVTRILGFVAFGLWIGLAANRLGFLSSVG